MREPRSCWLVVAALLAAAAACNGDDDAAPATSAPTTTAPATTSPATIVGDVTAPATTAAPTSSAPATTEPPSGREVVALPGLLDASDEPIADDPDIATGVLANGLTYFVGHNEEPGAKVSLRLVVRAGAADELGDETGVAHFLEHMLFNGTERFPENELIEVLRGFGAEFGPDVNAYTSYDETVYELEVPNDDASVELAVDVLHQWLTAATIDEAQVVAERGVVLDEWRGSTQNLGGRLFALATAHYHAGTRYEGRDPIGENRSIESMDAATLRAFYDAWYRPDNAAIVVIGDVDVDDTVDLVESSFADVEPRRPEAPERTPAEFAPFTEPGFVLHADPDQTTVDVEVTLPIPMVEGHGTAALRAVLYDQLIFDVIVRRLARDAAGGEAPFDRVVQGTNSFVQALDAPAVYSITDATRAEDALVAVLDEYERVYRYGFDPAEVKLAVESARATYDAQFGPDGESQDWQIADRFVGRFLTGDPAPARAEMMALITTELDRVTPAALAERFNARYTNTSPQVIISAPESRAGDLPGLDTVREAVAATPHRELEPREAAAELPDALMGRPAPIEPVSRRRMSDVDWDVFDPVEYTYPNGARVILIPNDIVRGEVFLQASSPGGVAMVADEDVVDALFAAEVMSSSGAGPFTPADLREITSRYDVELAPELTTYTEGWWGRAATSDLEALLALLHLQATTADADPVALRQIVQMYEPIVADPSTDPNLAGSDALNEARYHGAAQFDVLPDPDEFATLDAEGVARVWADRFGDASDFVFVLSGDFDREEAELLADAYLGTLPGERGLETPPNVTPEPPAGALSVPVRAGTGDSAYVEMLFTSPAERLDPALDALVDVVNSVVEGRLTRVIREQYGDSYSPFAISWVDEDPDPVVVTYVYASGSPDRIAAIGETVRAELTDLATGGLTDQEFRTALAPVVERYGFIDNGEFLQETTRAAWNPDYDLTGYVFKHEALEDVTLADVEAFLREHVPADRFVEVVVTPR